MTAPMPAGSAVVSRPSLATMVFRRHSPPSLCCRTLRGMHSYDTLRYAVSRAGVATIALNQPETRNALSDALYAELLHALERSRTDSGVGSVVLTSTHPTTFCAGGNLGGFSGNSTLIDGHFSAEEFPKVFEALGQLGKPSICAANGHVLAGGLGLALACDLIIAKEQARFGTPEINVGVFPSMVMALMSRNVGRKTANELLLRGKQISAREAERIGLVNCVVAEDAFDEVVAEWATDLAARSPVIMRLGKDAMYQQQDMALADALAFLRSQLTLARSTEDIREGVAAFFEKRDPVWQGR